MSVFLLFFYLITFSYIISKWKWVRRTQIKSPVLLVFFFLKVLAGFGLVYLYGNHYDAKTSDIHNYFNDAIYLKNLYFSDSNAFWNILLEHNMLSPEMIDKKAPLVYWSSGGIDLFIHEKKIIILLNLIFSFISLGNIYTHSLLMAFIGFIGQLALYRFVKKQIDIHPIIILFIVFLLPTFTIWSSSILKEPLIILSLGFLLFFVGKWSRKWNIKYLLFALPFLILGLLIKPYVIICLSLPLVFFLIFKQYPKLTLKKQSWLVFGSLFILLLSIWAFSKTNYNPIALLSEKQESFRELIASNDNKPGSEIEIPVLEARFHALVLDILPAFSRVMFKPHIYDFKNLLYLPDILQNLLVLVLALMLARGYRKPKAKEIPFLWLSFLFIFLLFTLIGLVTPVLGSIVRYKIPALPFVYFFLLCFTRKIHIPKQLESYIFR